MRKNDYLTHLKLVKDYWDAHAENYIKNRPSNLDKVTTDIIMSTSSRLVLEAGVGPAVLATCLVKRTRTKVVGVDISRVMLDLAKKKIQKVPDEGRAFLVQATIDHLPFQPDKFDAIICAFTLHHLPPIGKRLAFREFKRILGTRSKLVIIENRAFVPHNRFQKSCLLLNDAFANTKGVSEYHVKYGEIVNLLKNLKFTDIEVTPYKHYPTLAKYRTTKNRNIDIIMKEIAKTEKKDRFIEVMLIQGLKAK